MLSERGAPFGTGASWLVNMVAEVVAENIFVGSRLG